MVRGSVFDDTATPAPRVAVLPEKVQPLMVDTALTLAARPPPAPPSSAWLPLMMLSVRVKEVWTSPRVNAWMPPPIRDVFSVKRDREIVMAPTQPTPPAANPAELPVIVDLAMVVCSALLRMAPPLPYISLGARLPEKVQPLTVRLITSGEA